VVSGPVPHRGRERAPGAPQGRGRSEGRTDQEAQAEGRRARPRSRHSEGGEQGPPFCPEDVGRVRAALPGVSERRGCRVLAVARSVMRRATSVDGRRTVRMNEGLAARIAALIQRHPTFGYRRLWALLRVRGGQRLAPTNTYSTW